MGKKASEELIIQKSELFQNMEKIEKAFHDSQSYSGDEKKKDEFLKNLELLDFCIISRLD